MMKYINLYITELVNLTNEMAPWLLLGLVFAGFLKVYFPQNKIEKHLGKPNYKSAINASLLGIPMPLCSCGVIPTGVSFYKNGASAGATNSFLISTPQTGVDSIMATYSMLGLPFAIIRPLIAFITGVTGGIITNIFTKNDTTLKKDASTKCSKLEPSNKQHKILEAIHYSFIELLQDIIQWLIIGLLAAALISVVIPDNFFTSFQAYGLGELLVVIAISTPMYICATGSIPVAAVLLMKGISPGAAIVFLMAGPATNIATMSVIGKAMGRKALIIYLSTIIGGALLFGLFTNWFIPASFFLNSMPILSETHLHIIPHWLELASSVTLVTVGIFGYFYIRTKKKSRQINSEITFSVEGMSCSKCEASLEKNILMIKGIEQVIANKSNSTVKISGKQFSEKSIEKVITQLGFTFKGRITT